MHLVGCFIRSLSRCTVTWTKYIQEYYAVMQVSKGVPLITHTWILKSSLGCSCVTFTEFSSTSMSLMLTVMFVAAWRHCNMIQTSPDVVKFSSKMKGTNRILRTQGHAYRNGNSHGEIQHLTAIFINYNNSTPFAFTKRLLLGPRHCVGRGIRNASTLILCQCEVRFSCFWNGFIFVSVLLNVGWSYCIVKLWELKHSTPFKTVCTFSCLQKIMSSASNVQA